MKNLYLGEWVQARNFMSKRFKAAGLCSICSKGACVLVWYNVKTKEVRCLDCWNPREE